MKGRASVIDGDTVEIASQRIRFNGIDAPESRQHCDDAKGFDYPCGR
ncbi:MAG: thermonuclease family protein, partial [Mesorhizobium sp.]